MVFFCPGCSAGFYGVNCSQSCTCIEDNQIGTCDHTSGQCHCLSNYTGQNCEMYIDTVLPKRNVGPGVIVGSVLGSVAGVVLITTLISVAIIYLIKHIKSNKANLTISPSQQFKSTIEKVSLDPSSKQISPNTEMEMSKV